MDRWFDEAFRKPFYALWSSRMGSGETEALFLPVDVFEDNESVIVKAEMPGMKKEEINVELTADSITISGKKNEEERVERNDYHRIERSFGTFTRTVRLPMETVTEKARAVFKDGVLEVRIPKSETAVKRVQKLTVE